MATPHAPRNRIRILLMDDDEDLTLALQRRLKQLCPDWVTLRASSGLEAFDFLEVDRERINVIVADISMPFINGLEVLKSLGATHPHIIRIVLSGMLDPASLVNAPGCSDLRLCKPCPAEKLRDEILALLKARGAEV